MPQRSLPEDPSLENLKKQAKGLRKAVRGGEAKALAQVAELHPRAETVLAQFTLSEAQLVTARSYGFASWPILKEYLEVVERFLWDPPPLAPAGRKCPSRWPIDSCGWLAWFTETGSRRVRSRLVGCWPSIPSSAGPTSTRRPRPETPPPCAPCWTTIPRS